MGRNKVKHKNKNISISLPEHQIEFINTHPDFILSAFVRLELDEYMNIFYEIQELKKEVFKNDKKTTNRN